ncbi:MAG: hypothetical protein HY461_02670 [Parcubacteria group bacterium]|nr:hypothetical protein [Parcubacteria group bacterium]
MKIVICGSMQFAEKQIELRDQLAALGHEAFVSEFAAPMTGKSDEEKERMKLHQKLNLDAMRQHWNLMQGKDCILVANVDKHGIKNYIGGNTFLEIGFAHVLGQKIFLLNPIPDMPYTSEIEATKPIILNGDLSLI